MEYTFRWFGQHDPSSLNDIRQIGVTGIVTSLANVKYGEKWTNHEIIKRKKFIEKHKISQKKNLKWSVVESLPVHNDIKKRDGKYKYYIDQYKKSLVNLGKQNIKIVCYNFMPLVDWIRTDLNFKLPNGSIALKYNHLHVCAFENFILKSKDAINRYTSKDINLSKKILNKMTSLEIKFLKKSLLGGLAATDRKYSINDLNYEIDAFKELKHGDLRNNLKLFLDEIYPILKEQNIKYCIHPDDPPYNIYGLPRVMSNEKDIQFITSIYNNDAIGLTLCTGSLGVSKKNNLKKIISKYGKFINFIHLRNIKRYPNSYDFHESAHLDGDINMIEIIKLILKEERRREKINHKHSNIPMRPDHGHTILDDKNKKIIPGYSLLGRMKGLSELKGAIKILQNK
ncbi:MAG: Mannonate dehydratase [Alphaproteobacteria bacterium MarineAlpha5_Bin5]|nr:MAG: Mannonate dehydratase [Alphaproteobacteria bacterium MarineAlpha5_Bin5]|tara:strand:- start:14395 stop:15588 length:1194 start_codon:yes stop_codon:yes gene_type:complete